MLSSTALCCEAVCFIGISGWRGLQHMMPATILEGISKRRTKYDMVMNRKEHMQSIIRTYEFKHEDTYKVSQGHMQIITRTHES